MSHPSRFTAFAAAVLIAAACQAGHDTGGDAAHTSQSGGDVTRSWNPLSVTTVEGVPAANVRSAIQQRLSRGRPNGITADHWTHVRRLYEHYGDSPLWLDADGPIDKRIRALSAALVVADSDALDLSEYPLAELTQAVQAVRRGGRPTAEQIADADVLLTASYAALGEDLMVGQVTPTDVNQNWHINPREKITDGLLVRGLATDALDQSFVQMRPQIPEYEELRKAFGRYREIAAHGGWGTVPTGRALKPGERDDLARLETLRARLRAEGYDVPAATPASPPAATPDTMASDSAAQSDSVLHRRRGRATRRSANRTPPTPATGPDVYDRALAGVVAQFQAMHAIVVDSILGDSTVDAMNKPADYRVAQIAANLERYRWMPRSLGGRYIWVNVPAFRLEAYDSGQKVLDSKVVVGQNYQDKTTPAFADSMEFVVFRPYWNVTDDIAEKEIWPKVESDPSYLAENDMETYQEAGKTRIRQRPGEKNSLGYVKFLFPNDFNIYLHDTPAKSLFDKDVRAFSHGCIRVEKPVELAEWVLGWPAEKVEEAMHEGPDNHQVRLPKKIPVYITYFTAFAQDGQLHFGNDLYDRDDALVQLTAKSSTRNPTVQQELDGLKHLAHG